jgi:hypothetical protein
VTHLILKRAWASRPSGQWNDEDYDVLADGAVVGRIFQVHAAPLPEQPRWGRYLNCVLADAGAASRFAGSPGFRHQIS